MDRELILKSSFQAKYGGMQGLPVGNRAIKLLDWRKVYQKLMTPLKIPINDDVPYTTRSTCQNLIGTSAVHHNNGKPYLLLIAHCVNNAFTSAIALASDS